MDRFTKFIIPLYLLLTLFALNGCGPDKKVRPTQQALDEYIREAHARQKAELHSPGSLFNQSGPGRDLYGDFRAHNIDDIVTIRVYESTNALSSANASSASKTKVDSSINALGGLEKHVGELSNLADSKSERSFSGKGSTDRQTTLSTTVTARVVDVLPNGNLVVKGVREVKINNENQIITLTGVVRPSDISPKNEVPSTAVADLQVYVEGKGTVSKSIRSGWLFRLLMGLLPF